MKKSILKQFKASKQEELWRFTLKLERNAYILTLCNLANMLENGLRIYVRKFNFNLKEIIK